MERVNDDHLFSSKALYDIKLIERALKENDQKELDLFYGKNADGSSKMVRSADGTITASTNLYIASDE